MMHSQPIPVGHDVRQFCVESAAPYGWVVYCEGSRQTHFFGSENLAVLCARLWARAKAPSRLDVKDLSGKVTRQWVFDDESDGGPIHGRAPDA